MCLLATSYFREGILVNEDYIGHYNYLHLEDFGM